MAAWRGGRAKTWITGVLAFVASIVEAFTGYLSQQNFDSQWIATNASIIALVATFVLAGVFSSADDPAVTIQQWAQAQPVDFVGTAASELAGTSDTAVCGPPYTPDNGGSQRVIVSWQNLAWQRIPVDAPNDFVLTPLSKVAPVDISLTSALETFKIASSDQRTSWLNAYLAAANLTGDQWGVTNETGSYPGQPWLWLLQLFTS